MAIGRSHDKLYLNENRKKTPKEYFKFINKFIDFSSLGDGTRILDIGCATGDFLWYINSLNPNLDLAGIDVDNELLQRAKNEVPTIKTYNADISKKVEIDREFDFIFMNGVHSIFEDFESWLGNVLDLMREGNAKAYIFGIFNPEDLDIVLRVRPSGESGDWESGWNCPSQKSIGLFLDANDRKYSFSEFQLDVDIEKTSTDPLRSWTQRMENGENIVLHGSQLVHRFSLLQIT